MGVSTVRATEHFQAEWPEALKPTTSSKTSQLAWDIFSFIILPIGLLRLANRCIFQLGGSIIHPASWATQVDPQRRAHLKTLGGQIVHFRTPDGQLLEGMLFKGSSYTKRAVVYAPGNGENLESGSESFLKFIRKNVGNVDVLILNYRSVGNNKGSSSPTGLALDVYSAGEYFCKLGMDPSHVFFYGRSLGGYAALKGAEFFQNQHTKSKISVATDRSFGTLTEAAAAIVGSIASMIIYLCHWQLDARDSLEKLKGQKIVIYDRKDNIIPYAASFFKALQNRLLANTTTIELVSEGANALDPHNRAFTPMEAQKIGRAMRQALAINY